MKKLGLVICASIAFLLFQTNAKAWSAAGHQVIAAEAFRQLSPADKAKVTEILKAHPDYEKWKESFSPDNPNLDLAMFIFMRSSSWPDEIRRRGNGFDHPKWHYVDYPLKPTKFPIEPGPSPNDDILFGIEQSEKALSNSTTTAQKRAVYLSWLIHLIGDLHQPLHCCSLVTDVYPVGDKGGNSFFIKPAERGITLHSFWDGLLGTSGTPQSHMNDATLLQSEHPRKSLPELTMAKNPKEWSLEGREIAVEKAYLRGDLKGGTDKDSAQELPEGYTKAAKTVAEKQAALAGYRLADEIGKWVKCKRHAEHLWLITSESS